MRYKPDLKLNMIYKSLQLPRLSLDSGSQSPDAGIKVLIFRKQAGRMIESKDDNSDLRRGFNTMKLECSQSAENNERGSEIHRNLR